MGQTYIARNLSEYINIVKDITEQIKKENPRYEVWFRGQENCNYDLSPKGLRNIKRKSVNQYMRKDIDVDIPELNIQLKEFKRKSLNNLEHIPSSEIDWLIIAQHYGLATKLLDWTTNALIGLYFSLANKETLEKFYDMSLEELITVIEDNDLKLNDVKAMSKKKLFDLSDNYNSNINEVNPDKLNYRTQFKNAAAVYIMSPNILNKYTINVDSPIYVGDKKVDRDMECFINANSNNYNIALENISDSASNVFPVCINCNEIDKRIRNQSGCFTLHGYYCAPLDFYTIFEKNIHKVYIPFDNVELIRNELAECGINKYFVYQDLNSLSDEINEGELKIFNMN